MHISLGRRIGVLANWDLKLEGKGAKGERESEQSLKVSLTKGGGQEPSLH